IGIMEQSENAAFRNAIELRLFAQEVDLKLGRVVVQIRIYKEKSRILIHLGQQLVGCGIDLVGVDAGESIGELSLNIGSSSGADLQRRIRLHKRHCSGHGTRNRAHQLPSDGLNWSALRWILQEGDQESLVRRQELTVTAHSEGAADSGIGAHDL